MKSHDYCRRIIWHYSKGNFHKYFSDFLSFANVSDNFVLDVGCGIGFLCEKLEKEHRNTVIGVDINVYALRFGKRHLKLRHLIFGNISDLPFKDAIYDAVFLIDVLEHLKRPARSLMEIRRVLKPCGMLLLITPNRYAPGKLIAQEKDPTHCYEYTWLELKKFLEGAEFQIEDARALGFVLNIIDKLFPRLSEKMSKLLMPLSTPSFWVKAVKKVRR